MDKESEAQAIFDKVLKEVKPNPSEIKDTTRRVNGLMELFKEIVPRDVELRVAGSIARGTNLKGAADVDIFMLFNKKMGRDTTVKLGLAYGKKVLDREKGRFEIKYAEHPYIRLYLDSLGMKADIVPALKIDDIEEMGTTVDRTPLHTEFINSSLNGRQRDEVRVLKSLLKANGIYGAEVKTNGFSGYLCELLVHHYGSLYGLLTAASKFKMPLLLEPKVRKDSDGTEAAKRFNSQFIVIDPVDANRNVAAGVSPESLSKFVLVARKFIENPSYSLFQPKKIPKGNASGIISKFASGAGLDTFVMVCKTQDKSEDVIYPQLRKMNHQIVWYLGQQGFTVYLSLQFVSGTKGVIFIAAPKQQLDSRILKGPSAFMAGASQEFIKKHKGPVRFLLRESDLYVLEKSRFGSIGEALGKLPKNIVRHKDISFAGSKPMVNKVPNKYSAMLYAEMQKTFLI